MYMYHFVLLLILESVKPTHMHCRFNISSWWLCVFLKLIISNVVQRSSQGRVYVLYWLILCTYKSSLDFTSYFYYFFTFVPESLLYMSAFFLVPLELLDEPVCGVRRCFFTTRVLDPLPGVFPGCRTSTRSRFISSLAIAGLSNLRYLYSLLNLWMQ